MRSIGGRGLSSYGLPLVDGGWQVGRAPRDRVVSCSSIGQLSSTHRAAQWLEGWVGGGEKRRLYGDGWVCMVYCECVCVLGG